MKILFIGMQAVGVVYFSCYTAWKLYAFCRQFYDNSIKIVPCLVKFDTIVSDGAANGWNNIAGARKYETLIERFFADTKLQTVFFHDHLFANPSGSTQTASEELCKFWRSAV